MEQATYNPANLSAVWRDAAQRLSDILDELAYAHNAAGIDWDNNPFSHKFFLNVSHCQDTANFLASRPAI